MSKLTNPATLLFAGQLSAVTKRWHGHVDVTPGVNTDRVYIHDVDVTRCFRDGLTPDQVVQEIRQLIRCVSCELVDWMGQECEVCRRWLCAHCAELPYFAEERGLCDECNESREGL